MALPLIQFASGTITAGTSGTAVFSANVNKGSAIVVFIGEARATNAATAPTDTNGATYVSYGVSSDGAAKGISIFVTKNSVGGPVTVTANASASTTAAFIIMEFAGLGTPNTAARALDPNSSSATTGTTTAVTNGSAITSVLPHDLWIFGACNLGANTYTVQAGWVEVINAANGAAVNIGVTYKYTLPAGSSGGFGTRMNQSSTAAWIAGLYIFITANPLSNNFQFVRVGNGMSTSEKIR